MVEANHVEDETVWRSLVSSSPSSSSSSSSSSDGVLLGNGLCELESELRCVICGEFYNIPVSLQGCYHTFCSECIDQHISASLKSMKCQASCPLCKHPTNSNKTTPNRTVANIVQHFRTIRPALQQVLLQLKQPQSTGTAGDAEVRPETVTTENKRSNKRRHTITDLTLSPKSTPAASPPPLHDAVSLQKDKQKQELQTLRKPLPTTFYKGLKKKQLQQLCQSQGLSTAGTESQLKDRHQKFRMLYNSQCNSFTPMTQKEVAAEIHRREKVQRTQEQQALCNGISAQVSHVQRLHESRKAAGKDDTVKITSGNDRFDALFHGNFKTLIEQLDKRTVRKPRRRWTEADYEKHSKVTAAEPTTQTAATDPVSTTTVAAAAFQNKNNNNGVLLPPSSFGGSSSASTNNWIQARSAVPVTQTNSQLESHGTNASALSQPNLLSPIRGSNPYTSSTVRSPIAPASSSSLVNPIPHTLSPPSSSTVASGKPKHAVVNPYKKKLKKSPLVGKPFWAATAPSNGKGAPSIPNHQQTTMLSFGTSSTTTRSNDQLKQDGVLSIRPTPPAHTPTPGNSAHGGNTAVDSSAMVEGSGRKRSLPQTVIQPKQLCGNTAGSWECQICTFINQSNHRMSCQVCCSPRGDRRQVR